MKYHNPRTQAPRLTRDCRIAFFIGPGLILTIEASGESGITERIEAYFAGGWTSLEMWPIIRETCLPMAVTNTLGLVLFLYILHERGYEMVEHSVYLSLKRRWTERAGEEMTEDPDGNR